MKLGNLRFFERDSKPIQSERLIVSHDGRSFFHHGKWVPIPFGGAVDMIQGNAYFHEQFLGPFGTNDTIAGRCHYAVTSSATFAAQGVNGGAGRATLAGDDADAVAVYGPLAYEPDEAGRMWMQVRLRISDVSVSSAFIGFTDAITDTVIIEDEDGTLNTVATDAFGIILEGQSDGTWQTMGVGNGSDDTQAASDNIADPTDSTFTTIHIEADSRGNTARTTVRYRVYVDGVLLTTASTDSDGWVSSLARSSIVYAPAVSWDDRGSAYTSDLVEMVANGGLGTSLD